MNEEKKKKWNLLIKKILLNLKKNYKKNVKL